MPVGPTILCPVKATRSAPSAETIDRQLRHGLGGVDASPVAPTAWPSEAIWLIGLTVPSTFDT